MSGLLEEEEEDGNSAGGHGVSDSTIKESSITKAKERTIERL